MDFIDLKTQQNRIREGLKVRFDRILEHGAYIMGPEVTELEEKLAEYCGVKHAISCSSGTDALLSPLMAWNIGPGDAVFTTPFTYVATAEVISLLGATPVFVDVYESTFNIDCESVKNGKENFSPTYGILGETENGVQSEYAVLNIENIYKISKVE